ncbi:MAG: acyl-CoA dehydrogenase family protein [Sphaerobacter sp.]|nr:acyl-CoA dehydrogenase family protein [Sphaerobacter sp.]
MAEETTLLLPAETRRAIGAYFEPRAAAIDAGTADVREGLTWLHQELLSPEASPTLLDVGAVIATVAWFDLSSAFSLWSHRAVLAYLATLPEGSFLRATLAPRLQRVELLGATALAPAIAHVLEQAPLPVTARRAGRALVLDGRIPWASNLFPPGFVLVTVVAGPDGPPCVVAIPGDAPGFQVAPYPALLALQATGSSALTLAQTPIGEEWILSDDFPGFMRRVRPVLLLLQACFSWGLAARSLAEARAHLRGASTVFLPEIAEMDARLARLGGAIRRAVADGGQSLGMRAVVELRLDIARLAAAAVAVEAKVLGGRGFLAGSGTARRLREAAFLPIQSPTEAQLLLELSRSG